MHIYTDGGGTLSQQQEAKELTYYHLQSKIGLLPPVRHDLKVRVYTINSYNSDLCICLFGRVLSKGLHPHSIPVIMHPPSWSTVDVL